MKPKVVIIGGGFGGLNVAKSLAKENVEITLIDKTNHHLFQPLLYQVATAALSPGEIAVPIRSILKKQKNVQVVLREVGAISKTEKKVYLKNKDTYDFDYLIVATGTRHSYFGNDTWEKFAPGLKNITDALKIRERILLSFERAEVEDEPEKQRAYLTFVIIGAGPTGVEMAGSIAEIAHRTMLGDFRHVDTSKTRIILVEGKGTVLSFFPSELSSKAHKNLTEMGVEVRLNTSVTNITARGVQVGEEWIWTPNVIWAAGNQASGLGKTLEVPLDKSGRVMVEKDLSIPEFSNIFVIGDAAHACDKNGQLLPALGSVAVQQGKYIGKVISQDLAQKERKPFSYKDYGVMATIGRARAVAQIGTLKFFGWFAWLLWCFTHIMLLIGFRNKAVVMSEWMWSYVTYQRAARLITDRSYKDEQE